MMGIIRKSTVLAALLLAATFAYAGDLKPVNGNSGGVTPAPQGSHQTGIDHANANSALQEDKKDDKVRKLRPVK